jgi:membrane-bound ClpP family serine protease
MEWMMVIALILIGLVLIVIEVIFIPGTTLVGLVGFLFVVVGVGLSFKYFGADTGWATLGGSAVTAGTILYFAFKTNVWTRFALKSSNPGRVNEGLLDPLTVGMTGTSTSVLRPVGNAEINGRLYEVRTLGDYVESGKQVRIMRINDNKIFVESLN